MSAFFVPTRFTWRFGGSVVHLCGSFTRWVETVPMGAVEGQAGIFSVVVHLPPGYHQYKFIVDGEWRHDETQPYMPDPLGNVNNWLFVRRADHQSSAGLAGQMPQGHQAGHQGSQPPQNNQNVHPLVAHMQGSQGRLQPQGSDFSQPQSIQPAASTNDTAMSAQLQPAASAHSDVDMATESSVDSLASPITSLVVEPAYTRKRVRDFLHTHTCYELIPESGKVVLLDTELPIRQAFHALHEQGVASAPLWDSEAFAVVGMISASDFIHVLRRLRNSVSSGANPMSEAEMDAHTIRGMRDESAADGRPPKQLVCLAPHDNMQQVINQLFRNRCSMAPVLTCDTHGHNQAGGQNEGNVSTLLHIATISGVLACLMRHFRASLSSLPLLAQAVGNLPIGTWGPDMPLQHLDASFADDRGEERRDRRKVRNLHTVNIHTPLTTALGMLLEAGVSVLPVVDEEGRLLDMYARSDITQLAKGNSYSRLQWEEVTVGQALALASQPTQPWPSSNMPQHLAEGAPPNASKPQRVHICTARDSLRSVVERLSVPGVRRLFVVQPDTRRMAGILSLSDVAAFLFDVI